MFSHTSFSDNINLFLDPINISTFVLDKYHPNYNSDLNYYSLTIDGSVNMPLYHLDPEDIYFDYENNSSISQLSFKQNKNDKYFNTKIAASSAANESTKSIFQIESKSLIDNINQNGFLNINKKYKNLSFDASYLYHYDEEPTQYNLSLENSQLYKENESFVSGYKLKYILSNLFLESDFSIQTSNHVRPESYLLDYQYLSYNQRSVVSSSLLYYNFKNLTLFIDNKNYDIILEDDSNDFGFVDTGYNINSLGLSRDSDNIHFKIYARLINEVIEPGFEFNYELNNFKFGFQNVKYNRGMLVDNQQIYGEYILTEYEKNNINFSYMSKKYNNSIDLGKIKSSSNSYNYFLFAGNLSSKLFDIEYDFFKYFNKLENLGIDEYMNIGFCVYPLRDKYEFELYGKLNFNHYVIDRDINLLTMDLFNQNINKQRTQLYSFEFGFNFDSFIISYNSKNLLSNNVIFSDSIVPFKRFDYIKIIWIFKD